MVDAVVSFTIEKLNEFVTKHVKIRTGVKDGIEWLKDELGYLLISVRAAEAHQDTEHIRLWTDNVREVSNQAVLILERFTAQQEENSAPEQGGVLHRMWRFICICKKEANLFDIGKEIESLKEKVVEDVIGFEDDVRTLLAQLGNGDPSLGLISIHGMGCLGKSALASKLYHSRELSHFKSRAWVCVSEDYNITHVLSKIINSFTGQGLDSLNKMEEIELLRHLRTKLLDGDHYLVVIDDIWDVDVWKKIKNAFPDKKNGSRVIMITRSKFVAEGVDSTCFVHQLRFLREGESWELFCNKAKPTPNLEILGKEMVDVKDHLWRKLKGESSEIKKLLNLSYDDLSFPLRQCFLYLARFPEDYTIEVSRLKLLWIAEQFVSDADEEGVDMEDVAEDYVNELMNRNMI
ncbi:hypothetical protein AgCh_014618 [Apium graveolens]